MPAPPPESDPAMLSTVGGRAGPGSRSPTGTAQRTCEDFRARREDRVAADRRDEQATVLVAHLAAHRGRRAVAPVQARAADDLALDGRLDVVDRDVDRRDSLLVGRLRPQRGAHAVVHERIGRHAGEQASRVDQLGADRQADGLRVLPAQTHERADAVERHRHRSRARRPAPGALAPAGPGRDTRGFTVIGLHRHSLAGYASVRGPVSHTRRRMRAFAPTRRTRPAPCARAARRGRRRRLSASQRLCDHRPQPAHTLTARST